MILAQASVTDISAWLIGTPVSVLGFLVVAFIQGWVVPGRTHQRALDRNDQQAAELDRLHTVFEDKVIPALTRSTDLMAKVAERERTG